MNSEKDIKKSVRKKYGEIAMASDVVRSSCCAPVVGCCDPIGGINFSDSYDQQPGYQEDADLGLGCGLPTAFSDIKPGQLVLDLGSGAGNDVFVARAQVGETGKVLGLDMAPEMVTKAEGYASKFGFSNVEFLLGEIESIPLNGDLVDVVISNCVLNLVPNKDQAFREIFRVLKPGGHFTISDVILEGELPEALAQAATLYVGCVAGAMQKVGYLEVIKKAGFQNLTIQKEKSISLPEPLLEKYLGAEKTEEFLKSDLGIFSITLSAFKP